MKRRNDSVGGIFRPLVRIGPFQFNTLAMPGYCYAINMDAPGYGKRGFNVGVYSECSDGPRPDLDMNRQRWFLHFGSARKVRTGESPAVVHLRYPSRDTFAAQSRAEVAQAAAVEA